MHPTIPGLDRATALGTSADRPAMNQRAEQAIAQVLREHGSREGAALSAYRS